MQEGLQKYDGLRGMRVANFVGLATSLLKHSTDNEAEAFAIFQEELVYCAESSDDRERYSIEILHKLCLSASRPESMMIL